MFTDCFEEEENYRPYLCLAGSILFHCHLWFVFSFSSFSSRISPSLSSFHLLDYPFQLAQREQLDSAPFWGLVNEFQLVLLAELKRRWVISLQRVSCCSWPRSKQVPEFLYILETSWERYNPSRIHFITFLGEKVSQMVVPVQYCLELCVQQCLTQCIDFL